MVPHANSSLDTNQKLLNRSKTELDYISLSLSYNIPRTNTESSLPGRQFQQLRAAATPFEKFRKCSMTSPLNWLGSASYSKLLMLKLSQ